MLDLTSMGHTGPKGNRGDNNYVSTTRAVTPASQLWSAIKHLPQLQALLMCATQIHKQIDTYLDT